MSSSPPVAITNQPTSFGGIVKQPNRRRVFLEWSLHRATFDSETLFWFALTPVLAYGLLYKLNYWSPRLGAHVVEALFFVALFQIVIRGGIAARAVCWELSPEMRELVRLTGLGPIELLACKTISHWITIFATLALLLPVVVYAESLGGVTLRSLTTQALILFMFAILVGSMAWSCAASLVESDNSSATAVISVLLILLLYHSLFLFGSLAVLLAYCVLHGELVLRIPMESVWRVPFDLGWQLTPVHVLVTSSAAPDQFSPLVPSYWIHFLSASYLFRTGSTVIARRYRTRTIPDDLQEALLGLDAEKALARPRLQEDPFFWKDSQILCGGIASQSRWTRFYVVLAVLIFMGTMTPFGILVGCAPIFLLPVFLATRVDALVASEFRERTWEGLMLLPFDRRKIVWSKVRAVLWEQKSICLPIGIAVLCTWRHFPYTTGWTVIISVLSWSVICQLQILGHVTNGWWKMPLTVLVVIMLLAACIEFTVHLAWSAFLPECPIFFAVLISSLQRLIDSQLTAWSEERLS